MPEYKAIRIEKPVYDSLITLQKSRETMSQLVHRLVNFYQQIHLDVTLVDMPGSKKKEEGG